MLINPGFSTVYIGTVSFAIYIATASVMAFQCAKLFSYGIQLENDCNTVDCFLAAVLVAVFFILLGATFLPLGSLRCCSKFVVLLALLATDFKHNLQRGVVWSKSDFANANQFQITDDTVPFFGTSSSPLAAMFVCHYH